LSILIATLNTFLERWITDPRATELEHQIRLAVDKQKGPDTSVSGGDDSEVLPTSDDQPLGSYSASASDQGPDATDNNNRFEAFGSHD
jgi:hypothetical protein